MHSTALPAFATAVTASSWRKFGSADDHDVGIGVLDRRAQVGRRLLDAPALPERGAARLAARVHDPHAVSAALAVEGHRVEVADEPGPEHADLVLLHRENLHGLDRR